MNKKVIFAALATASIFATAPAAATVFLLNGGASITVPPTYTEGFNPANLGAGTFQDEYRFSVASAFTMTAAGFNTSAAGGAGNLNFGAVQLLSGTGTGGTLLATFTNGGNVNGFETSSLDDFILTAGQAYTVVVNGSVVSAPASYAGTFTFAQTAVPEPATWGMLLVGFGLVGAATRRTRRVAAVAA